MKRYKLVKQYNLKDCGVCSLATIIKYYNGYIPLEKLREMTKTNKNGTTAYHIIEAAKKLGFDSYGIKCEIKDFKNIIFPAIVYTKINKIYKHFMVIYEINYEKNQIVIADPMSKIKKITIDEFKEIYENILIVLLPISKLSKQPQNKYFNNIIKKIFISKKLLSIIFISIIYLILNLFYFVLLNNLLNHKNIFLIVNFTILILLKNLIDFYKNKKVINFNYKNSIDLTKLIFKQIIKLPYSFYRNRTTGDILTRFNDLEQILYKITNTIINIFINFNLLIIIFIFLINIDFNIFILLLITVFILISTTLYFKNKINYYLKEEKDEREYFNSNLLEIISGFETIKGLNKENYALNKLNNTYINYQKKIIQISNYYNKFILFRETILNILYLLIIVVFHFHSKNIFNLLFISFLLPQALSSLEEIIDEIKNINEIILIINRLNELNFDENKIYSDEDVKKVDFINIDFKNNLEEFILEDINLKISNNEKIMITGPSGSGKSTFLKLIKKYYKSNILINEKNDINFNNIIYVSQNEILFTDTLYNNIVLDKEINEEELNKIISICELDDLVKTNGYDMLIEENGFNISGGEKQRIVLARTLLTRFDYLLLDESLSEVDINLERKILKNIFNEFKNKTILLVSHRKDNLDLFDKLYEVKNKKIKIIERNDTYV